MRPARCIRRFTKSLNWNLHGSWGYYVKRLFKSSRCISSSSYKHMLSCQVRRQGRRQQSVPYDCSAEAEADPHNILEVLALAENAQHLRKTGAGVDQTKDQLSGGLLRLPLQPAVLQVVTQSHNSALEAQIASQGIRKGGVTCGVDGRSSNSLPSVRLLKSLAEQKAKKPLPRALSIQSPSETEGLAEPLLSVGTRASHAL